MGKPVLVVVDVQNDFVDGALGTPEAQAMLPNLVEKVRTFPGDVFFTLDTHGTDYLETREGTYLPVEHCIKGTSGWELAPALAEVAEQRATEYFEKPTFGSTVLVDALRTGVESGHVDSVELVGLCTDICVISNALLLKAAMPETPISVDSTCCAGVTPEKHEAALDVMESCHIDVKR